MAPPGPQLGTSLMPWSHSLDLVLTGRRIVELGIAHVPENRRLFPRMTVEDNPRMAGFILQARGATPRRSP